MLKKQVLDLNGAASGNSSHVVAEALVIAEMASSPFGLCLCSPTAVSDVADVLRHLHRLAKIFAFHDTFTS